MWMETDFRQTSFAVSIPDIYIMNGMGGLPKTYTPVETTPLQLSNRLQVLPMNQEL